MKLLEIHKNGINAHNNEVSFYGIDFQTKTLMFDEIENVECAIEIADCTVEEAKESRDAFVKVQTLIYQRMRETKKIILTAKRYKLRAL